MGVIQSSINQAISTGGSIVGVAKHMSDEKKAQAEQFTKESAQRDTQNKTLQAMQESAIAQTGILETMKESILDSLASNLPEEEKKLDAMAEKVTKDNEQADDEEFRLQQNIKKADEARQEIYDRGDENPDPYDEAFYKAQDELTKFRSSIVRQRDQFRKQYEFVSGMSDRINMPYDNLYNKQLYDSETRKAREEYLGVGSRSSDNSLVSIADARSARKQGAKISEEGLSKLERRAESYGK